mmetsp:Transcript_2208/g.3442  ORF Transcript_2208/g.3442 Transcript_2208/m.3442 type:complete len:264 (+) Transcript_2208:132-923(+)
MVPLTTQHLHSAFALLLCVLSVELHNAHGWSLVTCADGISYNKVCESACNNGYEKCGQISSINAARVLSTSDKCSKVQGKCMSACYATAVEMCSKTPSGEGGSDSNDEDSDYHHGRGSNGGLSVEEAFEGIVIAVGAAVMLFLLVNNGYGKGDNEGVQDAADQRELIGQNGFNEELSITAAHVGTCRGHGDSADRPNGSSDMILANNNVPDAKHSMITSRDMISSVQSSIPAIQVGGNSANQDQRSGLLLMQDTSPKLLDFLV